MVHYHRQLAAAHTSHERTVLETQPSPPAPLPKGEGSMVDRHIDRSPFELYGLSAEEIKIVEEGTA